MRECDPQANPFAGVFPATRGLDEATLPLREKGEKGKVTACLASFLTYERKPVGELSHETSAIPWH
jgi:hypothetical protein